MIGKAASLVLLLLAHPIPPAACATQQREDLPSKLRRNVTSYRLQANNFVEALTTVASEFQIPMGIEWVDSPAARAKVTLSWKNATVLEVIQAIIKTQPGLHVLVRPNVLRVSPAEIVPDRQNPLKINIKDFEVHGAPVESASRKLHEALKQAILQLSPMPSQGFAGGVAGSGASNVDDPKITVSLKNATVEDILDALTVTSARKIWIVTFSETPSFTPAGFRKTLTLWNDYPIPDTDQPVWDLLHWGDRLTTDTATR